MTFAYAQLEFAHDINSDVRVTVNINNDATSDSFVTKCRYLFGSLLKQPANGFVTSSNENPTTISTLCV